MAYLAEEVAEHPVIAPISRRVFLLGTAASALSACAIPRGAPTKSEILAGSELAEADFAVEMVTRARLPIYRQWGQGDMPITAKWPSGGSVPQDQRLAAGDRLSLRIWDSGETSLFTSPGAQFADIQNVVVSGSGHVDLPYVDAVHVGGLTVATARARLQERLTEVIPSAQVQLEVTHGRRNSVDVVGGVARPGSYPLNERNLPLTSLLALAGGVDSALVNPMVQITRGGTVYRRTLKHILSEPAHDSALQGGDRIVVQADPRRFTALGAAGKEQVLSFDADKVSALRAVSMMGGMADQRADPKGILVLRKYDTAQVGKPNGPLKDRVIFSFDLTNADGLFSADDFGLVDGDVVMATQAPATNAQRVIGLFGSFLGAGRAISSL
ncbi:MAG: polysaccharide biosynthesis/export family protein [Roseinatronobacter sp.]